jgi:L-ribulose-5-phosphate 3-epimerase
VNERSSPVSWSRRELLSATASAGVLAALGCRSASARPAAKFSVSLAEWSLHRALQGGTLTNLDFPVVTRRDYGIGTCEYVNSFFKEEARNEGYLYELMLRCRDHQITNRLIMIDGEGELAHADQLERRKAVVNHHRWIDCAARLGCMAIRVNAAGSGDPGEMQKRAAESLVQLADYGDDKHIAVIVENHGGWSSNGEWLAGVMRLANDSRVGTLPDFGNFDLGGGKTYDRYQGIAEMMPFAKAVSAKSHEFDERGEEVHTNYHRMLRIVDEAGYHGPIGIEYEGDKHSEPEGIRLTKALLERVRDELPVPSCT